MMNCSECQDLLVEYSLGELARGDADQVDAHLACGCEACHRELDELQDVLAMLGSSLAPVSPATHVKRELFERIQATGSAAGTIPFATSARPRSRAWRVLPYAAAILCGFFVGAAATRYFADDGVGPASRQAQLAALVESARQNFGSPEVRFVALHPAANENAVVGHLMWDARGRSLHFFAFDLEPPAEGQQLAVWFETSSAKPIYAGELSVSDRGACSAVFDAPALDNSLSGPISGIVVTEEPAGAVAEPHGPQRIVAHFSQPGSGAP